MKTNKGIQAKTEILNKKSSEIIIIITNCI